MIGGINLPGGNGVSWQASEDMIPMGGIFTIFDNAGPGDFELGSLEIPVTVGPNPHLEYISIGIKSWCPQTIEIRSVCVLLA